MLVVGSDTLKRKRFGEVLEVFQPWAVLEAARLDDFVYEERRLKGRGEGGENYPPYKNYQITRDNTENWR